MKFLLKERQSQTERSQSNRNQIMGSYDSLEKGKMEKKPLEKKLALVTSSALSGAVEVLPGECYRGACKPTGNLRWGGRDGILPEKLCLSVVWASRWMIPLSTDWT